MSHTPERAEPCPPDDLRRPVDEQYRSLVEATADAIILQARGGEILVWNPAAERVFGISATQTVGRTSLSFAWATYRPDGSLWPGGEHPSMLTLRTGQPCRDVLMEVRTESGQRTWVTVNTVPIFGPGGGEPEAVAISFTDITAHRAAEEALRLSESRFRTLFELAGAGMAVIETMSGRFVQVNDAFCRLLGYAAEELTRTTVRAVTHPGDLEQTVRLLAALKAGAVRQQAVRKRYVHKSGGVVWVDLSFAPLWPSGHRPDFHVIVVIDITARMEAEEALERSRLELRAIYEHAPTMMCVLDSDQRVLYANRALHESLGSPFDHAVSGRACAAIGCPWAFDETGGPGAGAGCEACDLRVALADALATGRSRRHIAYRALHQQGDGVPRERVFVISVAPIGVNGRTHVLMCLEDVTEREHTTAELRASQAQLRALAARLEDAREAERSHVAREIHDVLAQDLTRLKIDLSRLRGRLRKFGDDADDLRGQVAMMSSLADTAISNVQRIATELRPPVLDSLGLSAAVDWHAREFQDRTGIACRVTVPDEEPAVGRSVATAVFRILQESLTNVVRHAEASAVDVGLEFGDDRVTLTVRDNGRGISREEVSAAASIGIAGMRERATLLGGEFVVRSETGAGTLVVVRIPLTR